MTGCMILNNFYFMAKYLLGLLMLLSNTVLMHYDGGSSGYGSGGSLVNTLFPKYKHHKLNLNSLKNYG